MSGPPAHDVRVRLVREDDAPAITELLRAGRSYHAAWDPERDDAFFTEAHQREVLRGLLAQHERGTHVPFVITERDVVVGRITIDDVVRGAFESAHLGYWVGEAHAGRGVATAAVAAVAAVAFGELGLHRLQADTLVHNAASRRVLARTGFTEIGFAPRYLRIAGRWQDCVLHQRLADDPPGPAG